MRKLILPICLVATATSAFTQQPLKAPDRVSQDNPLSGWNKRAYGQIKDWLQKSAEKMPEKHYSFKPTEVVRSYGQIIGHAADVQFRFCSIARGEKNPSASIEKTKTSKADLIAALNDAFAYCDKAYDMTDVSVTQMVKLGPDNAPKISVLSINIAHLSLHHGNLVTYMR